MALTDEEFREEFKPLRIPPAYPENGTLEDKILFALAAAGEATSAEVCQKLTDLEQGLGKKDLSEVVDNYLKQQFDKGLINGGKRNAELVFNLNKITHANEGSVDPDLLAPGLD
ncbi:hypothetical protein GZH53_03610 [Flavihumibacter sp. R14]|nr:hypothetical protein [Flavihumibacter soli]